MTNQSAFPAEVLRLPAFDGPFEARRVGGEGADVLFAEYPAGTVIGEHTHDTTNVGVVVAGELLLTVDGHETRYGVGEWYRVPARAPHSARFEVDTAEIEVWIEPDPPAARTAGATVRHGRSFRLVV